LDLEDFIVLSSTVPSGIHMVDMRIFGEVSTPFILPLAIMEDSIIPMDLDIETHGIIGITAGIVLMIFTETITIGETIEITVLPLRESNQDVVKKPIPMIIPDLDKTQKKQEEKLRISKIRLIESI
jgi:hypothetical protein